MQFKASQMSCMDTVVDFLLRSTRVSSKSPEWNLTVHMQQMMILVKGSLFIFNAAASYDFTRIL